MQWTRTKCCTSHCMAQECVGARHLIYMVIHVVRLSVPWLSVPHFVLFRVFFLSFLLLPESWAEPLPPCGRHRSNIPLALRQLRSLALWPIARLSQVLSPTSSTISTTQILLKWSSRSNPATRCAERSLYHHGNEKNQRTEDKLTTLLKKVCCQLSPCLSVMQERLSSLGSSIRENPSRGSENEQIRFLLWTTKKSRFSPIFGADIHKHEFQADSDRRSIQELCGIIESQQREIDHTLACYEQLRRDQQLLHEQFFGTKSGSSWSSYEKSKWDGRIEAISRIHIRWIFEKKMDRDTILELTAKIQELQNEVNRLNDSRDFKDAESVRSGLSHVTSQPALFPPFRVPGGMLSRSVGMPSRNDRPPDIWDTHGLSGNVFVNPTVSSSAPYPQGFNPWICHVSEHTSPHVTSESQTPNTTLNPRCQSGPSARNSFDPVREDFRRIMEQTNNDCRFRILILTNSLHQRHLFAGR